MKRLSFFFDWTPSSISLLVPGILWFGSSSAPAAVKAPPLAAPAPLAVSSPTQSAMRILQSRSPRLSRAATIMGGGSDPYTTPTSRRTILGIPIA